MNNRITDVIVHTDDQLNELQYAEVVEHIHQDTGVVSICRNSHTPKFLIVVYNAGRTQSKKILNLVTGLGYRATLVGM